MSIVELQSRIASIALDEWWFFGTNYVDGDDPKGPKLQLEKKLVAGKEKENAEMMGFKQRVWTYFKRGVYPKEGDITWADKINEPWSAAFISYCMRAGGTGDKFPYSVQHSDYVLRAVRNRDHDASAEDIIAWGVSETHPYVGDLLWRGRKPEKSKDVDTSDWGMAELRSFLKRGKGSFVSHCDLVTSIDAANECAYVVGGNVQDTVMRLKIALDDNGMIASKFYRVIIQNKINENHVRK